MIAIAVCYFNKDYEKIFNCEYEKKNGDIEVTVEYAIYDEIEPDENGAITIGSNTQYKKRDILIVDSNSKMNYLLKAESYSGGKELYGPHDGKIMIKFLIVVIFIMKIIINCRSY